MKSNHSLRTAAAAFSLATAAWAQPIVIDTVVVGNSGNAADPLTGFEVGSVGYVYHIGKYEVTNAQYAAFLNLAALTDPFGLYNDNMAASPMGGIIRSGSSGSFTYAVKDGYANMPVTYVSFWDAARFANWMSTGYTEGRMTLNGTLLTGASYDLNFATSPTIAQGNRLAGAKIYLPSESEWHKAAYHQPSGLGGDSDNYWLYATGSNSQPSSSIPGSIVASANFRSSTSGFVFAVTQSASFSGDQNYLTEVGAYGENSESYYGTADQNGNVAEWTDSAANSPGYRVQRGGNWLLLENELQASTRRTGLSTDEDRVLGFRLASTTVIPEPGTYAAIAGALALAGALWRRRGNRCLTGSKA